MSSTTNLVGTKWERDWRDHTIRLRVVETQDTPSGLWALYDRLDENFTNPSNKRGGIMVAALRHSYRRVR